MLRYIPAIFTVFLVLPAAAQDTRRKSQGFEKQLQPVAFLVGKHMGTGRSAMGGYRESLNGNWALGKTAMRELGDRMDDRLRKEVGVACLRWALRERMRSTA